MPPVNEAAPAAAAAAAAAAATAAAAADTEMSDADVPELLDAAYEGVFNSPKDVDAAIAYVGNISHTGRIMRLLKEAKNTGKNFTDICESQSIAIAGLVDYDRVWGTQLSESADKPILNYQTTGVQKILANKVPESYAKQAIMSGAAEPQVEYFLYNLKAKYTRIRDRLFQVDFEIKEDRDRAVLQLGRDFRPGPWACSRHSEATPDLIVAGEKTLVQIMRAQPYAVHKDALAFHTIYAVCPQFAGLPHARRQHILTQILDKDDEVLRTYIPRMDAGYISFTAGDYETVLKYGAGTTKEFGNYKLAFLGEEGYTTAVQKLEGAKPSLCLDYAVVLNNVFMHADIVKTLTRFAEEFVLEMNTNREIVGKKPVLSKLPKLKLLFRKGSFLNYRIAMPTEEVFLEALACNLQLKLGQSPAFISADARSIVGPTNYTDPKQHELAKQALQNKATYASLCDDKYKAMLPPVPEKTEGPPGKKHKK